MKKCCYCFGLDVGCILIGVMSIISSLLLCVGIAVFVTSETMGSDYDGASDIDMFCKNKSACKTILVVVCLLMTCLIISSALLIYGIKKNNATCVLVYFVFGVLVTIVSTIAIILELLKVLWVIALAQFVLTGFFVYTLLVTYAVYEMMLKGLKFGSNSHQLFDSESLISTIN